MTTQIYDVHGMHCASCATIITKKLSSVSGVQKVNVNFASEKAQVEHDSSVTPELLNHSIHTLGYSVSPRNMESADHSEHLGLHQTEDAKKAELEVQKQKTQFVMPVALMIFVLMMWDILAKTVLWIPNLPLPMDLFNTISLVISTIVLFWIGKPFIGGVSRFFRFRVANMDTLIGIGTLSAYVYSAAIVLIPTVRTFFRLPEYTYFDVVIVVIGFITFGKYLEARSKQKTGEAIEKLLGLQAKTAIVLREGKEMEISVSEVMVGDVLIVKPGAKIPVDGKIIEGSTSIDESMVSGEPVPVDKTAGDVVIGATINKQGHIKFEATKVGSDTVLAQIIKMVEDAQGSKAPIQELADRISGIFVPVVLGIATLALILWLTVGTSFVGFSAAFSYGLLSFVGVLVIACPCALGLATPTAIIVGVGKGAEHGILVKDAESLELLSKVDTIVLDKTGTITKGKPEVTDVVTLDSSVHENQLLEVAGSVEKLSEHPLAEAIVSWVTAKKISLQQVSDFKAVEGVGVTGVLDGRQVRVRKPDVSERNGQIKELQTQGKTVVVVEIAEKKVGLIALADTLKENAKEAIGKLHDKKIDVIILTGDNHLAAEYIAQQAGVKTVFAEVLPQDKANHIQKLQAEGKKVAMVGDGINDAPALVSADVGIAMATGTDVAIESAGITLLHGDIHKIADAVVLSKKTMRTIRQNLFWAFIYNIIGIPVAAGLLYPLWGIILNPIFAGLAMAGSSVSVVANSLRLKLTNI